METPPRTESGGQPKVILRAGCGCLPPAESRAGLFWGAVLLLVGTLWLLGALGLVPVGGRLVLPLLVVALGVWYLAAGAGR